MDSRKWIVASALVGFTAAVIWLGAPPIPALIGAIGAAALLYFRNRQS